MSVTTSAGTDHLVEGLTPAQRQAVTTASATVCVLASAGAGKTRVLARRVGFRVASGQARPEHVLAITFTRKAAGELRDRLSGLGLGQVGAGQSVTAGTFHSLASSQLKRWWADRRSPEPVILERKGRLLAELVQGRPGLADASVADLASHIEWAKARVVAPAGFALAAAQAGRELSVDADAIAGLYARYEDEKRRRRLVDFDDLLERYADALGHDSRFAAAQRWRWQHVFVDELQDVNPLQCRLLTSVLGDNDDLFVVGDPNQAIYGWNGADPGFLADFPQRWPQAEVVHLDDNHRSSPQVVAVARAALGRHAPDVRSSQPDGPRPKLRSYPTDEAEAAGTASELLDAHDRGVPWAGMAVLARTNSQLVVIGETLGRAGVPFRSLGASEERGADGELTSVGTGGHERVTVSSFHRSKGLQWRAVWVCGLEVGLVPIAYAVNSASLSEERRLLYVALTRAETELHCSWARSRRLASGASLRREPSPWVIALAPHCAGGGPGGSPLGGMDEGDPGYGGPGYGDHGYGAAPGGRSARPEATMVDFLSSARRRLARTKAGAPVDDDNGGLSAESGAAAERLREWRRRLARASGVPAHVLLHDATVTALAISLPATTEELLAVPGLGPVKVARYGPAILEVVHQRGPLARQGA